jgi:Kelch motif
VSNYTAVATLYRLDMVGESVDETVQPTSFDDMGFELQSPAPSGGRGDLHAVELYGYAYVAGGISHTSAWCEGLTTTERYHMATDTWETLSDLNVGRADMAVAVLNNKIISMGGETKPENCVNVSDPAYGSFPASHVEVLLINNNDDDDDKMASEAKWEFFEDFNDERFRFAAAVVPGAPSRIYTFGGQLPFDFTCDCFPTSDDVGIGTEVYAPEATSDSASGSASSSTSSLSGIAIITAIVIGFLLFVACIILIAKNVVAHQHGPRPRPATTVGPKVDFEPTEPEPVRHETA